jgi:catechol 2,3-dioxygenase-like lactoylglutathione lyase family enzyme
VTRVPLAVGRALSVGCALLSALAGQGCELFADDASGSLPAAVGALRPGTSERAGLELAAHELEGHAEPVPGLPAVRGLSLTVSDLDASVTLFEALDFELVDERTLSGPVFEALVGIPDAEVRLARLRLGSERVDLGQYVSAPGRAIPPGARANDAIFQHMAIVVRDMDEAFARLRAVPGVELVSPSPETIPLSNSAAGGIRALYFKDADGHAMELIWFPTGRGRARWHVRRTALFLGLDHSAIAVAESSRSELLYRALGFSLAGRSLNVGLEQERLSGVPGARVQITGFFAPSGPGIEFLSYLEPGPGAPPPADPAPNDLFHWEVQLEVPTIEDAGAALLENGGSVHGSVDIRALDLGYRRAALARDADGHALRLLER